MLLRPSLALALALAVVPLLAAPRASACSPAPPGLTKSIPENGGLYPGNAAVIFMGFSITLQGVSVTADGQPATLKDANMVLPPGLGALAATVEPTPSPGQKVVISGTFCNPADMCPVTTIQYLASPADKKSPPTAAPVGFDVYDYTDFKSGGGDCQIDSDFAFWVHIKSTPPELSASPEMFSVEAFRASSPGSPAVFSKSGFLPPEGSFDVELRDLASVLEASPLPQAFCFRVRTVDAAGNTLGDSPEVPCAPCYYRADSAPLPDFGPPPQPMWTSADLYPGGTCDPSTAGAGGSSPDAGSPTASSSSAGSGGGGGNPGQDVEIACCTCRAAGDGNAMTPGAGLAIAMAGIASALRRRRGGDEARDRAFRRGSRAA